MQSKHTLHPPGSRDLTPVCPSQERRDQDKHPRSSFSFSGEKKKSLPFFRTTFFFLPKTEWKTPSVFSLSKTLIIPNCCWAMSTRLRSYHTDFRCGNIIIKPLLVANTARPISSPAESPCHNRKLFRMSACFYFPFSDPRRRRCVSRSSAALHGSSLREKKNRSIEM